jgi:hypothetical protein
MCRCHCVSKRFPWFWGKVYSGGNTAVTEYTPIHVDAFQILSLLMLMSLGHLVNQEVCSSSSLRWQRKVTRTLCHVSWVMTLLCNPSLLEVLLRMIFFIHSRLTVVFILSPSYFGGQASSNVFDCLFLTSVQSRASCETGHSSWHRFLRLGKTPVILIISTEAHDDNDSCCYLCWASRPCLDVLTVREFTDWISWW